MKRKLSLGFVLLLIVASISACKKQDEATKPLKEKMIGRWQVTKIETDGMAVDYTPSDYIDFKSNNEDEVEFNLEGDRYLGNYVVMIGDVFHIVLSNKTLICKSDNISASEFKFTGKVEGTGATETYYLRR